MARKKTLSCHGDLASGRHNMRDQGQQGGGATAKAPLSLMPPCTPTNGAERLSRLCFARPMDMSKCNRSSRASCAMRPEWRGMSTPPNLACNAVAAEAAAGVSPVSTAPSPGGGGAGAAAGSVEGGWVFVV